MGFDFAANGISAEFSGGILRFSSGGLQRTIDFANGAPRTLEIRLNDTVFAVRNPGPDLAIAGMPFFDAPVPEILRAEALPAPGYDGDAVYIEVETLDPLRNIRRLYRYILYPGLPMTGVELELVSAVTPLEFMPPRLAAEQRAAGDPEVFSIQDTVTPALEPDQFSAAEFRMRTDYSNDLVRTHVPDAEGKCPGSVLEWRSGALGGVFFQEAPPPNERQESSFFDFLVRNGTVCSCGLGFREQDIVPGRKLVSHRNWFGIAGDTAELVRNFYLRRLPEIRRKRYSITVNPWGSGQFYDRIGEKFLLDEIAAAGKCGADLYQIDDGYQQGGTLGDIIRENHPADRSYWEIDRKKLPGGLAVLAEAARRTGIELGMWFAPGTNREFADFRESAEILLDWYRKFGIRVFKLDGIRFASVEAERNFVSLLKELYTASGGDITANLDVTNGLRGGVGYLVNFGSVFLENRYVGRTGFKVAYHPQDTLRNLWNLSRLIPTVNLQIEVPSVEDILPEIYAEPGRPPRPDEYDFKFWLGAAFFASPLLWFQPSRQSPGLLAETREIMDLHRKYREEFFSRTIRPAGGEPGSGRLTGFYAEAGFGIVYRTLNAEAEGAVLPENSGCELLYATGPAELDRTGRVRLERPGSWALWRVRP